MKIYIYIYTTILIAIGCTIVYILISIPDTKAKIQRTLSSKLNNSAINLLQSDSDGNLSCIPAPLDGQQNYYLSGGGSWQKSVMRLLLNLRKLKPGFVCFIHLHRRLFPASLNNVSVNIYSVKIYIYIYI